MTRADEPGAAPALSPEEREELLGIARRAAEGFVSAGRVPEEMPGSGRLRTPGAAFVTLSSSGRLRGCIGYTEAVAPLFRTVQECAVAAATGDPRFPPVTPREMGGLRIEISVLSPLSPIRPRDVVVGIHGLMIRKGGRRGLLLPQVPSEYGWDRETYLDQLCEKAGLPRGAWREGADLYAFTAEVFGEEGREASPARPPAP